MQLCAPRPVRSYARRSSISSNPAARTASAAVRLSSAPASLGDPAPEDFAGTRHLLSTSASDSSAPPSPHPAEALEEFLSILSSGAAPLLPLPLAASPVRRRNTLSPGCPYPRARSTSGTFKHPADLALQEKQERRRPPPSPISRAHTRNPLPRNAEYESLARLLVFHSRSPSPHSSSPSARLASPSPAPPETDTTMSEPVHDKREDSGEQDEDTHMREPELREREPAVESASA